jgi:hypothetical protein
MVSYSTSVHWGLSMGKQDRIEVKPVPAGMGNTGSNASGTEILPKMALASIVEPPIETPPIHASCIEALRIGTEPMLRTTIAATKIDLASIEAPQIAPDISELKPTADDDTAAPPAAEEYAPEPAPESAPAPRVNRFAMLAACLALAAGLGGMVGALGAYALVRPQPTRVVATGKLGIEEIQALKENVVQARVELAALKASYDAGNRNATTQLAKVTERIERMERNAGEPAAKINKAVENLERLSRAEGITRLGDATGSIAPPPALGKPAGLDGWVVRDVRRGTAFIEGRAGMMEVEQGDLVPGLGRIDAIRKQDGRWVVVTSRGLITMR